MAEQENGMSGVGKAGAKVLILGHKCYRCGHEWRPYEINELPIVCPKCKSPYWKTARKKSDKKSRMNKKNNNAIRNGDK